MTLVLMPVGASFSAPQEYDFFMFMTATQLFNHWVWDLNAIATIVALVIGPILAVQTQKWLERRRDERHRKVSLFRELMATRASRLSGRHVEALNTIELEYDPKEKKQKKVHEAWRSYLDALNSPDPDPTAVTSYYAKRDDLFIDLLYEMGQYVGFSFDRVAIRRDSYAPKGHGQVEDDLNIIRKGFAKIFTSKSHAVPIRTVDEAFEGPALVSAEDLWVSTPIGSNKNQA
jgi:hypothetical protein